MAEPTDGGSGVWLYAVVHGLDQDRLGGVRGVGDEPVRTVAEGDLVAVVGTVDLREFGEEPLRQHLEDLAWLETVARTHHRVIDTVAAAGPTVPIQLATVYRDDARIGALLAERRADFTDALRRVAGHTEWGVKAFGDPDAFSAAPESADTAAATGGPGTAYLQRRRAQRSARENALQRASALAEEIHRTLGDLATAARSHPARDTRLAGEQAWMVLNASYLVDDARTDEFNAAVERLASEHPDLRLAVSGPWPPYSFADASEAQS